MRHLVAGDPPAAVHDQLVRRDAGAGPDRHDRVHRLAPAVVGDPEHGRFHDLLVLGQGVLDLDRVHVLGAGDDHVLEPVDHVEVAVRVGVRAVTGAVPAVDERRLGLLRAVPVAQHHVRAADPELADLPRPQRRVRGIANLDLDARHRRAHRGEAAAIRLLARMAAAVVLRREMRDRGRRLGHAVKLRDLAREPVQHAPLQLGRDRRGGVLDVAQAAQIRGGALGCVEQHPQHRRDERRVRDPLALDRREHRRGLEARQHDLHGAHPCARVEIRDPGHVEHRAHVEEAGLPAMAGGDQVVERVGEQVGVAEHHALGRPGRAPRVGDRRQRVLIDTGRRGPIPGDQLLVGQAVVRRRAGPVEHQPGDRRAAVAQGPRRCRAVRARPRAPRSRRRRP